MSRVAWLLLALPARLCLGMTTTGRPGHGFIGYGISMWEPVCPHACRAALSGSQLNCSTSMAMDGEVMTETSTLCYATDLDFLSSVAWCIKTRCVDMKTWQIEQWWQREIPGKQAAQPDPQWTYQETLDRISIPPTLIITKGDPLNATVAVSDYDYHLQATTLAAFAKVEINHSKYGLVLLTSSVIIPIAASFLRFLPLPSMFTTKIRGLFLDRALVKPSRGWMHRILPVNVTRGQALLVLYFLVINTVLCIVGYPVAYPNAWWMNRNRQILTYVTNRAGVLSFANIPVLILYAGRNNLLLWITDWEPSTFVLLHSCVAWICTIQAVLHSIIYLRIYVHLGTHSSEAALPYWYWGIIATLCLVILLPGSIAALRRKAYEVFLASHFAFALLALVGCYLHIVYKFDHQWGYELWIYIAFAVWGFDRLARILRLARHGLRTAIITVVDENYLRVDVAGVADVHGDGHAYLYFPTLSWRVWENHPFSVTTAFPPAGKAASLGGDTNSQDAGVTPAVDIADLKGNHPTDTQCREVLPAASLTFFIKVCHGMTSQLQQHRRLPVLVESGYASRHKVPPSSFLLCIAGGVGITAVIPTLQAHRGISKLYWSCRSSDLVDAVKPCIQGLDQEVVVMARHDISRILEQEAQNGHGDMVVLVSGPTTMRDEVREIVCRMAIRKSSRPILLLCEVFE